MFASYWSLNGQGLWTIVNRNEYDLDEAAPKGISKIPGGSFLFKVQGIEIEGSNDIGVDVQYPWEDSARRFHRRNDQHRKLLLMAPSYDRAATVGFRCVVDAE